MSARASRWRHLIDWPYWALDLAVGAGSALALCSFVLLVWSLP